MICVYFLLLSRPGAMIASGENSFPSEPLSRGDRCLPRVVELETASSAGNLSAHRGAATSGFSIGFVSGPMVDSPAEEDGFELAVPPRRERLWAGTPGKHCRFGPQPVSGSAFHAAVLASSEEPFAERDRWFESGSLHRRVRKLSVPLGDDALVGCSGAMPCSNRTRSHRVPS
jgi:hypothetical protein